MPRRRSVPHTFEQRIAKFKDRLLEQASKLPPTSPAREELELKMGQLEVASSWSATLSALPSKAPR